MTIPAGLILKVAEIYNSSSGFADDYISLRDGVRVQFTRVVRMQKESGIWQLLVKHTVSITSALHKFLKTIDT